MKPLPTDIKILKTIYNHYYDEFINFEEGSRSSKVYVPIDIEFISKKLKVDGDIVFGRLYYYLNKRYGYKDSKGIETYVFSLKVGKDTHAINFPLLASILASMREEHSKFLFATGLSIVAMIVSVLSVLMSNP